MNLRGGGTILNRKLSGLKPNLDELALQSSFTKKALKCFVYQKRLSISIICFQFVYLISVQINVNDITEM